jgi:hypothetical protein
MVQWYGGATCGQLYCALKHIAWSVRDKALAIGVMHLTDSLPVQVGVAELLAQPFLVLYCHFLYLRI